MHPLRTHFKCHTGMEMVVLDGMPVVMDSLMVGMVLDTVMGICRAPTAKLVATTATSPARAHCVAARTITVTAIAPILARA